MARAANTKGVDAAVMARLRAPFGCEYIPTRTSTGLAAGLAVPPARWRIHDANDDAIASVSGMEEGYARIIVQALNAYFQEAQRTLGPTTKSTGAAVSKSEMAAAEESESGGKYGDR